jgi:serralysin
MTTTDMRVAINWGTQVALPWNREITFSFLGAGATPLATNSTFQSVTNNVPAATVAFTAAEMQAVRDALTVYSQILNVTFREVTGASTFTFGAENLNAGWAGFMQAPGEPNAGYCGLDTGNTAGGAGPGTGFFQTVMHEIGHGLGLAHPHDNGGTSDTYSGVTASTGSFGDFSQNQGIYTMMSYNNGWQTAPGGAMGIEIAPMAFDIAVLQQKYGANWNYNTGNDTYTINDSGGGQLRCIWDANGNDTIAYNGNRDCRIDLNAASLAYGNDGGGAVSIAGTTTLNSNGHPISLSDAANNSNGFTIANGCWIENATGGTRDDILIGHLGANTLNGRGGNDALYGNDGNDTLIGGAGTADYLDGGNGYDTASYETSAQGVAADLGLGKILYGDAQGDTLVSIENLRGSAFDDDLRGGTGSNTLSGGDGNDSLYASGGDSDWLFGEGGDDYANAVYNTYFNGGTGYDTIDFSATADNFLTFDLISGTRSGTATGINVADVEQYNGETGNDIMADNDQGHVLVGFGGDDQLYGRGGGDTLIGGVGADYLDGGDGFDKVDYSSSSAGVAVDLALNKVLYGDAQGDTIVSIEDVTGSAFDDDLRGNDVSNVLRGGGGNDNISGSAGFDYIFGDAGDDTITAGVGADLESVEGGAGYDTVYLTGTGVYLNLPTMNSPSFFSGGFSSIERFIGTAGGDVMNGDGTDNTFLGGAGVDSLSGGEGADVLDGGADTDYIYGNGGSDTVVWTAATGALNVTLDAGGNASAIGVAGIDTDYIYGIENILGGSAGDRLTGNQNNNTLKGNGGADILRGEDGSDTLDGGAGADSMTGGLGHDAYYVDNAMDTTVEAVNGGVDSVYTSITHVMRANIEYMYMQGAANINGAGNGLDNFIQGNAGSNILNGAAGADLMMGLGGNDTYYFDSLGDSATEAANAGIDTVRSAVNTVLTADIEKLYLTGTALNGTGNALTNFIYGNALSNTLNGGTGADRMWGYQGNDIFIVDSAGDLVFETIAGAPGGTDTVQSSVNHTLSTNVERLTLTGAGNVNATGNTLVNLINGNAGNNFIDGKGGSDNLTGGLGVDSFMFTTALAVSNVDTITDFSVADDTIRLDDTVFAALSAGYLAASAFRIGGGAADATDRIIYNAANGALYYDADGAGGAAQIRFATLDAGLALTSSDFFVF